MPNTVAEFKTTAAQKTEIDRLLAENQGFRCDTANNTASMRKWWATGAATAAGYLMAASAREETAQNPVSALFLYSFSTLAGVTASTLWKENFGYKPAQLKQTRLTLTNYTADEAARFLIDLQIENAFLKERAAQTLRGLRIFEFIMPLSNLWGRFVPTGKLFSSMKNKLMSFAATPFATSFAWQKLSGAFPIGNMTDEMKLFFKDPDKYLATRLAADEKTAPANTATATTAAPRPHQS